MLDMNLVKQLNDADPEKRKRAITALAKTKDREALNYLVTVYQKDRDPQVRELARKAGIFINKHTGATGSTGADGAKRKNTLTYEEDEADDSQNTGRSTYYEEAEPDPIPSVVSVSPLDEERAAGLVKQALDIHMRGDNDRAIKYLQDALKRNPNLARDSYTAGLAATITGLDSDKAIRLILSEAEEKQKRKRGGGNRTPTGEPGWGDAIIDLVIYMLISAGFTALVLFVFVGLLLPEFSKAMASSSVSGSQSLNPVDPAAIMNLLTGISFVFVLIYSAVAGVGSLIALLIQYFFIHMISVTVLSGEGSFVRLVTKATLPMAFAYPVYYAALFGIIMISGTNSDFVGYSGFIQFLLSIGLFVLFSNRIGAAYRFDTTKGCAAIVLSTIAMVAVGCVCSLILPSLMAGSTLPR